jgi:hypothetical protein
MRVICTKWWITLQDYCEMLRIAKYSYIRDLFQEMTTEIFWIKLSELRKKKSVLTACQYSDYRHIVRRMYKGARVPY